MIKRTRKGNIAQQYRQGDVFLIAAERPADAVHQPRVKRLVLEFGEVTGHAHAIEETEWVDLFVEGDRRFLEVQHPVLLTHEEHAPVNLSANTFEVRRQRTWSVMRELSQRVAD